LKQSLMLGLRLLGYSFYRAIFRVLFTSCIAFSRPA